LDRPSVSAFPIHVSQKTLGLSFIVWDGYFRSFALGLIPAIAHHLVQSVVDILLARHWAKCSST